jgi:hypothetical protein
MAKGMASVGSWLMAWVGDRPIGSQRVSRIRGLIGFIASSLLGQGFGLSRLAFRGGKPLDSPVMLITSGQPYKSKK